MHQGAADPGPAPAGYVCQKQTQDFVEQIRDTLQPKYQASLNVHRSVLQMTGKVHWKPLWFVLQKKPSDAIPTRQNPKSENAAQSRSVRLKFLFSSEIGIMMIMSIISEMDVLEHNHLNCPSQRGKKKNLRIFLCASLCVTAYSTTLSMNWH